MTMNLDLVGHRSEPSERGWIARDCSLYALSVGAGFDQLAFVGERAAGHPQRVYPSFVCSGGRVDRPSRDDGAGMMRFGDYQIHQLVHGEQELRIHGDIGPVGSVVSTSVVVGIYDKGSGAVVHSEGEAVDAATGEPLFTVGSKLFIMAEGGFGGDPGPRSPAWEVGDAPPDATVDWPTLPVQSLLYRHGGNDPNLIHYDPTVAHAAGFDAPILMGLNTYGFACRALVETVCGGDPQALGSMAGRFAAPGYNGDVLTAQIWHPRGRDEDVLFRVVSQRGTTLLDKGRATLR
ncbi:MaoC/PaaZ C-terminal domain-containing protein [Candidatus Poriferisocius sp.]|uniref:MaoC/PaaZ C-terminal domain-containing protein n=1 Tax=Candidatus Poriferisocius sp. TaxID=3101276 RepID=UPI003B5924EF